MANNKKVDVFISYSRKNTECADAICAAFDKAGITYFIDRQGIKIEQDYIEKIANEIDNSKMVLFLASADSYRSKYINIELQYAFNNGVSILPYQIDDTKITKKWQMLLSNANWYNIHEHPFHSTLITTVAEHVGKEVYLDESNKPVDPQPHKRPRLWKTLMKICLSLIGIFYVLAISLAIACETLRFEYNYTNSSATVVEKKWLFRCTDDIKIPYSVKHRGVLFSVDSIGDWAFRDCSSLTSITIPNSVKSIGEGAFDGCYDLTSITIPNSVTSIGSSTFSGCSSLISITIPNSVTSIGEEAFKGCSGLISVVWNAKNCTDFSDANSPFSNAAQITSFTFGDSVQHIPAYLCYRMSKLTSIAIPNSVTEIGAAAFSDCESLISIVVEQGNVKYDSRDNCNAIIETASNTLIIGCQNTTIPNSVTRIGDWAFEKCSGLTSITIPNSVTSIGKGAFYGCYDLTSITIPNSVTEIGSCAFQDCTALTSVTIPNSVTSIGEGTFYGCSNLTSVTIPNSVMSIGIYAFSGCSSLTSVTIPNSVTSIGAGAFENCSSLTSITIPNSVKWIGGYAFKGCSSLTSVTVPSHTKIYSDAFPKHIKIIRK